MSTSAEQSGSGLVGPGREVLEEVALYMGIQETFVEKDWYVTQVISRLVEALIQISRLFSPVALPSRKLISLSNASRKTSIFELPCQVSKSRVTRKSVRPCLALKPT